MMTRIAGSDVYAVAHGWLAEHLHGGIVTVSTPVELETAVQDETVQNIFVPRQTFGQLLLEKILRRNSLVKTIFWEK